jgi:hypothetical protein
MDIGVALQHCRYRGELNSGLCAGVQFDGDVEAAPADSGKPVESEVPAPVITTMEVPLTPEVAEGSKVAEGAAADDVSNPLESEVPAPVVTTMEVPLSSKVAEGSKVAKGATADDVGDLVESEVATPAVAVQEKPHTPQVAEGATRRQDVSVTTPGGDAQNTWEDVTPPLDTEQSSVAQPPVAAAAAAVSGGSNPNPTIAQRPGGRSRHMEPPNQAESPIEPSLTPLWPDPGVRLHPPRIPHTRLSLSAFARCFQGAVRASCAEHQVAEPCNVLASLL